VRTEVAYIAGRTALLPVGTRMKNEKWARKRPGGPEINYGTLGSLGTVLCIHPSRVWLNWLAAWLSE
jgi:hypothetical protein